MQIVTGMHKQVWWNAAKGDSKGKALKSFSEVKRTENFDYCLVY